METIRNYLDNIFQTLPQSEETLRLKTDILSDMESKYHELRQMGRTENEAIGAVIGEFGNIDELLEEIGGTVMERRNPTITIEEARKFISASTRASCLVACGVAIILIAVSIFLGFSGLSENISITVLSEGLLDTFSLVLLLLMIIPAIALFIYSGTQIDKYKFIEEGLFELTAPVKHILKEEEEELKPRKVVATIAGVSLCIFSAAVLIALSALGDKFNILGVSVVLIIIAVAVFIFIITGGTTSAYEKLLKTGDFKPENKRTNKVVEGVAGVFWPTVVCVFLVWGFLFDGWGISWIVFPIAGMLFGGFSALICTVNKK